MLLSNKKNVLALLLSVCVSLGALADDGGSFNLMGAGARDLALAGAAHLHDAGLEALFLQPASLTSVTGLETGLFIQRYGSDLPLSQGTIAIALGSGERMPLDGRYRGDSEIAIGAAFQYLGATLADDTTWGEWTLTTSAAWSPLRWVAVGGRASFSGGGSEDDEDRGGAFAMDLGMRLRVLHPGLEAGILLKNFYHRFSWVEGSDYRRQSTTVFNLAFGGFELPLIPGDWRLEGRASQHLSSMESFGAGLEWGLFDGLATLRGGMMAWRQGETRNFPTFGFGFNTGVYQLDYGFSPDVDGGMAARHRFSLTRRGS